MPRIQTELAVEGPYSIPFESQERGTSKRITRDNAKQFWSQDGLSRVGSRQGCYVFALAVSRGYTPWYVGKATKSFRQESLHDHKLVHYNEVIYKGHKGKPVMFFVARAGTRTKIPKSQIDDLETFLIQCAMYKNQDLRNKQKTKTPLWGIRGVLRGGRGKSPENAKRFKSMLNI